MKQQQTILNFLRSQLLCVVATVNSKSRLQAATVAFSENGGLELCIGTRADTRKYHNLQHNKYVAITIGADINNKISIQFEGVAREVSGKEVAQCRQQHLAKNPSTIHFVNDPLQRFFIISPRWIRFCDYRKKPVSFEIEFNGKKQQTKKHNKLVRDKAVGLKSELS